MICFVINFSFLFLPLPHKQPQYQKQYERYIHRLETMQEEIHRQNGHKRSKKCWRKREYHPGNHPHNRTEENESNDSSFDQLLDIPTLGDVIILSIFYFPSVYRCIGEFHDIAIGRSRSSESLSHGMFSKSLNSSQCPIKMPFGRTRPHNNLVDISLVTNVEKSRNSREKNDNIHTFFSVFMPNGFERKSDQNEKPHNNSYNRTTRVGEKNESKKYHNPYSYEEMMGFLGSKIVHQKSDIDDDKIGSWIRSVKNPLESFDSSSIDSMVDGRRSPETPVRKIGRKSKMQENGFMEYKTHQNPSSKSHTCREEKYLQVLCHRSFQERTSVFCDEKCDEEFKVVPSTIYERGESESIYQRDNNQVSNIRTDQIIEDIELGEYFLLPKIPYKKRKKGDEKYFLEETNSRNPEFIPKKNRSKNAPRKKNEKNAENTVKHNRECE